MSWGKKLAKHHVEDGEDYNREERRHIYIDCHSLVQNPSLSSESISALIYELKNKEKYKIKEEEELH